MAQEQGQEKIYCGKAKLMSGKFGDFFGASVCLDDVPEQHIVTYQNGKRYINIKIVELRQPDDRGNTHTIILDTWKPTEVKQPSYQPRTEQPRPRQTTQVPQRQKYAPRQSAPAGPEMFDSDQIPF